MNCREFLIVFDERDGLNEAAVLHLKICGDCRKAEKTQTQIWRAIDNFKRVDAPHTFDFSVKARIAAAKPKDFQTNFLPVLRYVLPLGLIVLILGFVVYNSANLSSNSSPQVAEVAPQKPIEKAALPGNFPSINPNAADDNSLISQSNSVSPKTKDNQEVAAVKSAPERVNPTLKKNGREFNGGSHDSTIREAPVKLPFGLNANRAIKIPPNPGDEKSFTAGEVLSFLGVESVLENGKRRVKAVRENSLAGRSGVKVGDVIEAIDGLSSDEQIRAERIEGKTLTVLRGATKIVINLKN